MFAGAVVIIIGMILTTTAKKLGQASQTRFLPHPACTNRIVDSRWPIGTRWRYCDHDRGGTCLLDRSCPSPLARTMHRYLVSFLPPQKVRAEECHQQLRILWRIDSCGCDHLWNELHRIQPFMATPAHLSRCCLYRRHGPRLLHPREPAIQHRQWPRRRGSCIPGQIS